MRLVANDFNLIYYDEKRYKTKRISALISLLLVVTVLFSGNVFAGQSRSSERKFVVSDAELESYLSNTSDEMTLAKYSDYLLDESIDFTMTQTELIELIATTCYLDPSVKWRFETETGRKLELYTRSID